MKRQKEVAELGAVIRSYGISMRRLAQESGVSYNTVRSLPDGPNVSVATLDKVESALLRKHARGTKTCAGCRHLDGGSDDSFDFCIFMTSVTGQVEPMTDFSPCIAHQRKPKFLRDEANEA